jgi:hypothetical protein
MSFLLKLSDSFEISERILAKLLDQGMKIAYFQANLLFSLAR